MTGPGDRSAAPNAARFRHYLTLAGQMLRFGLVGVVASLVNIGVYWVGLTWGELHPSLAWTIGFVLAVAVGYPLQSGWSFGGHGGERRLLANGSRYLAVALIGFLLNSFWVWLLVEWLRWAAWTPIPLVLFATPLLMFILNRDWVFR